MTTYVYQKDTICLIEKTSTTMHYAAWILDEKIWSKWHSSAHYKAKKYNFISAMTYYKMSHVLYNNMKYLTNLLALHVYPQWKVHIDFLPSMEPIQYSTYTFVHDHGAMRRTIIVFLRNVAPQNGNLHFHYYQEVWTNQPNYWALFLK